MTLLELKLPATLLRLQIYQYPITIWAFIFTDRHLMRGPLRHINPWPASLWSLYECALRVRASVKDGRNKEWLVRSCGFILYSNQKDAWFNSPAKNSDKFKKPKPGNGTAHSAALHVATPFEIHGTVKAGLTRQSKRELLHSGKNRLWVHWERRGRCAKVGWRARERGDRYSRVTAILKEIWLKSHNFHLFSAQSLFLRLCANYWSFI